MKSKFKKLMAAALVLCLMLALLPAGVLADGPYTVTFYKSDGKTEAENGAYTLGTITAKSDGGGSGPFAAGTKVVLSASSTDSRLYTWLVKEADTDAKVETSEENGNITFIMPGCDVKVIAEFRKIVNISVQSVADADITVSSNTAVRGDEITVTVTPHRGYSVTEVWYNNGTKTDITDTRKFTVKDANVTEITVGATVEERTDGHIITISAPANGNVTTVPSGTAYAGETVTLSNTPETGYEFVSYSVTAKDGTPVQVTGNTFTMPDNDVTVSATFKQKQVDPEPEQPTTYTVTTSSTTGGSVTATPSTDLKAGDTVTVTVTPAEGYWLKSLKINGDEVSYWVNWNWHWNYDGTGTYTFNMPAEDVNIEAKFTNQLRIDTNYNSYRGEVKVLVEGDETDKWVDTNFADTDDWVAFKPVAYTNFNIGAISVTGNWTGRSYDVETWYWHNGWYYFRMPSENVTINVEFTDNSHAVNVKDASNGTLKANTKWAVEDERVYITAVPDKGYELTWLSVKAEDGTKIDVYEALKEDTYYFFMPDQAVTVSAIFAYDYPDMPFTDVNSNSWYFNAVEFVYNKGIMQGVSSTKFGPNGTVTRGMLVTMLWRMAGEPYVGGGSFDDVASGSYYSTAVAWAAKNGIVDGYNSTRFGPNDAVTREQIATMLYRYAKWLGYSTSGSSLAGYSDASSVSSWAKDAMGWAIKNSVVTGVTATKLNPTSSATRAETAQMFMNFYEYLN